MRKGVVLGLNPTGFHRIAYREWGSQDNERVLVCVHGLARNGRDFDEIAKVLSREYRVICPDMVGRGESDWLPSAAAAHYAIPQYVSDMTALLARLNVTSVDWLGTSMGGIIGMAMAALPQSPIRKLILNDIGAFVSKEALAHIGDYLVPKYFADLSEAKAFMQQTYPGLSKISAQSWDTLVQYGFRETEQGWTQHYDPTIGDITRAAASEDVDLWAIWRAIQCPQLLIWGDQSDVLTEPTVTQMCNENPQLDLYRVAGVPHVPSLMETDQISHVCEWLRTH
ncbi:alpha/beta hydrolase [Neptunomonas sp. XY-337]|uniref:alpha/beta fold hydrolase n=1 Tax=Neptunomonas sp. XY-337 TaxID=2561897 RepID=UPI0010A9B1BB|nr:alpha/beta hydrolase [Neptunomonas sp. XY-337]